MNVKLFFLIGFLCFEFCSSQIKDSSYTSSILVNTAVEYGNVLKTNPLLKEYDKPQYAGYTLQILKQTTGKHDWEKLYNFPRYGIGISNFDYLSNREMGSPFAIYGIFNSKIKQWEKFRWSYDINFGISFNSKPFNWEENYYNVSVGKKNNMYVGLGTAFTYELGKYFDVGLNLKFNHLSNGGLKMPNKGLNFVAPQVSLIFFPERNHIDTERTLSIPNKKYETWELSSFFGKKNVHYRGEGRSEKNWFEGFDYKVYGLEGFYMRQYSRKSAYGLGVGITKDEHYNNVMFMEGGVLQQKKRFSHDQMLFSIIPSYRLIIDKLHLNIGLGYYVLKKTSRYDNSSLFQRIGLQYQLTDHFFASFGINAYNFHQANYLEWKLGYTFKKKEIK